MAHSPHTTLARPASATSVPSRHARRGRRRAVAALAACLAALGIAVAGGPVVPAVAATAPSIVFSNGLMAVANLPSGTAKVKWYAGSPLAYLGQTTGVPWSWRAPTSGVVQARVLSASTELARLDASVPSATSTPTASPTPTGTPNVVPRPPLSSSAKVKRTPSTTAPAPSPSPSTTSTPVPTPTPGTLPDTVTVTTTAQLVAAFRDAVPGRTITVAPGDYAPREGCTIPGGAASAHLCGSAVGTAQAPVTVNATGARLVGQGTSSRYGLYLSGASHWRITGLAVTEASKGIVLDRSTHITLDAVDVGRVGDEGIHFRHCSSDGVLRGSRIHDTGLQKPQYGEGVYVGSASSNWGPYACTDGRDNSERVLVEGNVFENITAEGADLKEGTDSGTLRGNLFVNTGFSGANFADSAVDAKGNGWQIELNVVRGCSGACLDAFQTHSVYSGYGTRNTFRGNVVEGSVPGYAFGLYPVEANTVRCDNVAPGAVLGLIGVSGRPGTCTP